MNHVDIEENADGRDFIIGDLHGEWSKLCSEMALVDFNPAVDRLFSVGDLIDRGPESEKCLSLIDEPWFHAVIGNHEQMAYDSVVNPLFKDGEMLGNWYMNGGNWHAECDVDLVRPLIGKIKELPLTITIGGRIGICHANPPHDWASRANFAEANLLWGRTKIRNKEAWTVDNIERVYVGHTPVDAPVTLGNCHYIDTGACFGGRLTMREIPPPNTSSI